MSIELTRVKRTILTPLLMMAWSSWAMAAAPVLIYDSIPAPLPPNVPSLRHP